MKTLTSLTITNLKQNRARTIMTIAGVALSVAFILACIGFWTSISYSERTDAVLRFGEYHTMYKNIPGNIVSLIEGSKDFEVQFYSNPVNCVTTDLGFEDCQGMSPYKVEDYTAITDSNSLIRDAEHSYNVFVKYKHPEDYDKAEWRMKRQLNDAGFDDVYTIKNNMVAEQDGARPETTRLLGFWIQFIFIDALSIIAAFVIRNSFNISITERVRQFGMLASIGARPRQIRYMVYQEGLIIGLIAIPLGILLGCAATLGIVGVINALVGFSEATDALFYIPPASFGIITLAGIFIIILSASSPAIVASRVSPIAALRNVQDIKVKAKKLKTSKLTQKMWGIGGVIAAKNLKRSRSKYRTTVISIVLSVAVYIGISSFMMYGYKVLDLFYEDTGANTIISATPDGIYQDIVDKFKPKEYAIYYSVSTIATNDDSYLAPNIFIISRDEFARYARSSGANGSNYSNMVVLHDYLKERDYNGNYHFGRTTKFNVGDDVSFTAINYVNVGDKEIPCNPDELYMDVEIDQLSESDRAELEKCKTETITVHDYYEEKKSDLIHLAITQISDKNPMGIYTYENSTRGEIYISEDHPIAKQLEPYRHSNNMYVADSGLGSEIKTYVEDSNTLKKYRQQYGNDTAVYVQDLEEFMQNARNVILMFEIIIYGFIIVAALIGITNIFNTITTNIALRAKEFAVLKSVGMTEKEFNHMIRLESIMYTTRALLIGLPIGFLMSYGVSKLFTGAALEFGWLIPWGSVVICIVVVAALIAAIMYYSVRKIKKQNIIETIRKESF